MSFFGSLFGTDSADASRRAAADTYAKQQSAISGLNSYADTLPGQYGAIAQGYQPYQSAGTDALSRLMSGLGLGGNGADFTAAYRATPGYQAGLDTGTQAVARRANAGNMFQSGATLKALQRFGSDYEDQKSGDYLNRLAGVAGQGLGATGAAAGLQAQGLGAQTGLRQSAFGGNMQSAGTIGQGDVAAEQAKQSALTNLLSLGAYGLGSYLGGGRPTSARPNSSISPFGSGIGPFNL